MAEARPGGRSASAVGGALAIGALAVLGGEARGAETAKPAVTAKPPAAAARAPATAPEADLELLEFLGSDDVEPELQQYLANRAPARDGSEKR